MIQKTAQIEKILAVTSSPSRLPYSDDLNTKVAKLGYDENDGYMYVRCRAISSRVNKNNDGWPSDQLTAAYKTFQGRPIFVDHNNSDPQRTRGVVVSSMIYTDDEKTSSLDPYYATAPDNHKPPTWIELVMEIDAKTFPKLAKAIRSGDVDAVSMGANIERSVCSVCANEASTPSEYCNHIKAKGMTFEIESATGEKIKKKAYEDCYGINFFEISNVFDPADDTADILAADILAKIGSIVDYDLNKTADDDGDDDSDSVTCSNCGTSNDADAKTCSNCGANIADELDGKKKKHKKEAAGFLGEQPQWEGEDPPELFGQQDMQPADIVKQRENARLLEWRVEQFTRLGFSPEEAQQLAQSGADYHQYELMIERGATPQQAQQILSKTGAMPAETLIEPFTGEIEEQDDRNYIPQGDLVTAPQDVDTLRDEVLCPTCKSDHLQTDPDGIQRCPTCGYIQEPEPLNNPDLGLAQQVDLRQDSDPSTNVEGQPQVPAAEQGDNASAITINPTQSLSVGSSYILSDIDRGINEMNWNVKLETTSKAMADKVLSARAMTVDSTLGTEEGISFETHAAFKTAGIQASVRYPIEGDNTNTIPGNPLKDFVLANRAKEALGIESFANVPVKVTTTDPELAIDLIQGTFEKEAATKGKKVLLPGTTQATTDPKDKKVISDQLQPITSKLAELSAALSGLRTESNQYIHKDGNDWVIVQKGTGKILSRHDSEEKAEAAFRAMEMNMHGKTADRRHIKREEREENGQIVRSEEIVEESGDGTPEATYEAPVEEPAEETETPEQQAVAAKVNAERKLLSVFALADEAVERGIVAREEKMIYIASLEKETDLEIAARRRMLADVAKAGLSKTVSKGITSTAGISRIPRLASGYQYDNNSNGSLDSIPDEAIFG